MTETTETTDLATQLREAGYEEQANAVRDAGLAKTLEAAGHTDLAAKLRGEPGEEPSADEQLASTEGMTPEQITEALSDGRLDDYLGKR